MSHWPGPHVAPRRVLITGSTGMDGRHLAQSLAMYGGIEIFGLVRRLDHHLADHLAALNVTPVIGDLTDASSLRAAMTLARPQIIYHLGAMSSPSEAWQMPETCGNVTGLGTLRVIEAAPYNCLVIVAGSLATHGPYGAAKAYAQLIAEDARERGLPVTTIVMGGHSSPLRPLSYLTAKVAAHARRMRWAADGGIALNEGRLSLGPLGRVQDFGWAPEFMDVWARSHELKPDTYKLSTGEPYSVADYVRECYAALGLDWNDHVNIVERSEGGNLTDVASITAKPSPEIEALGFAPRSFIDVVRGMVQR